MVKIKVIVWLWNPWEEYENTRHNVWFKIVDMISDYSDGTDFLFDKKFNAKISVAKDGKYMIIFVKPQTFMNLSWDAVMKVINFYKIEFENLLVIHDEIDLEEWKIKLKWSGWDNGHNWLKDITKKLWTNKYWKLKMWVWRPEDKIQVVDYVLWKLPKSVLEHFQKNEQIIYEYVRQFLVNN